MTRTRNVMQVLPVQKQMQGPDAGTVTVPVETPPPASSAQEPAPQQQTTNSKLFTVEELEAARKQEKDKLYPKIEKLEEQLNLFNQEREEQKRLADEARQRDEEERRSREEEELSAKDLLNKKEDEWKRQMESVTSEWQDKFDQLQQESEAREQLLQKEREFQALQSYKSRRIQEESENLMPELIEFISGNTEDEIESSISAVAARTAAIMENIQAALPQRPRSIPATGGAPSAGPLENITEQQTFTADQIKSMSVDEYAQYRDRLLAATSRR